MTAVASGKASWTLREFGPADGSSLSKVARLHMELLHFGPMAGLGLPFVRDICYRAHMQGDLLRVALAEIDGEPAGFVAYTPYSIGFHRHGLHAHWFQAGIAVAASIIAHPSRILRLLRAIRILLARRGETNLGEDPLGEVVCVAVRKQFLAPAFMRSTGLRPAEALIRHAADELARMGVKRMRMIVDADNKPVLMLYHLMGANFEPYSQAGEQRVHVWFELPQPPADVVPACWSPSEEPTSRGQDESWLGYWERIADQQAVFRIEAIDYVRRLRNAAISRPEMRVLDFGCGFGHTAVALAPNVASMALWDASSSVRQRARIRVAGIPGVELIDLSSEAGRRKAGSFDLILAHSVLQYMDESEIRDWLEWWRSLLKPGGRIVLSDLIQPAAGGPGEILGYLWFAARKGFFMKALVSGVREIGSYWSARQSRPLTVVDPRHMGSWADEAGLTVEWLPQNLSHRRARQTAVLSAR